MTNNRFILVFSILILIMSCAKEKDVDQFTPCLNSVDSTGLELLWQYELPESQNYWDSKPIKPIFWDNYMIVQDNSSSNGKVILLKLNIENGSVMSSQESKPLKVSNAKSYEHWIFYFEPNQGNPSNTTLYKLDLNTFETNELITFEDNTNNKINCIADISNGKLLLHQRYLGEDGLPYYIFSTIDLETNDINKITQSNEFIENLTLRNPKLWTDKDTNKDYLIFYGSYVLEHSKNGFYIIDQETKEISSTILYTQNNINEFFIKENNLIIRTSYNELSIFDLRTSKLKHTIEINTSLNENDKIKISDSTDENSFLYWTQPNNSFFLIGGFGKINMNTGETNNSDLHFLENGSLALLADYGEEVFYTNYDGWLLASRNWESTCKTRYKSRLYTYKEDIDNRVLDLKIDLDKSTLYLTSLSRVLVYKIR